MTASVEIVIPRHSRKLQRAIGAAGAARFVNEPSARVAEQLLVASLADLNDAKHRKELDGFVDLVVEAAGNVSLVLIQAQPGEPTTGAGLQALVHWTTLLGREPFIAPDPAVVRRMILARQSKAQKALIASAAIDDGTLVVWTCEPRRIEVPVLAIPSLARMKPKDRLSFRVTPSGSRIHWDESDVDLTADAIRAFADPELRREQQAERRAEVARYASAIRTLREKHGLRQTDIRGLTERQVRRLEEGQTMPRSSTLEKLAAAHGMDADTYLAALAAISRKKPKRVSTAKSQRGSAERFEPVEGAVGRRQAPTTRAPRARRPGQP